MFYRLIITILFIWNCILCAGQTYSSLPYYTGFEGALDASWLTNSTHADGLVHVNSINTPYNGTGHLTLTGTSSWPVNYSTNSASLHLNLGVVFDATLSFWVEDYIDEYDAADGIYFSDDGGATYVKVLDIVGTSMTDNTYQNYSLNIKSLALSNGLSLTSTFVIKFQHYGTAASPSDGFSFDEISVVGIIDIIPPSISCPSNMSVNTDINVCTTSVSMSMATATDNHYVASIINDFNGTNDASGTYPLGVTTVTWVATDASGNTASCTTDVTVTDNQPPYTPTLSDVTGQCTATATAPTTTDTCSGTITGTTSDALTYSTQGTHVITWNFDDGNGNSINVNQDVVIDDTTDPVTPALSDVTGQCTATATAPTTTDACSGTITGTTSDALTYSTQGTHTITWTFADGNGNSINVNQDVVIDDTVDPVTPTLSDVTGQCTATATAPTTTDACSGTITGTTSDALTYSTQGAHTITWTFADGNGNSINVNQDVVIDDTVDPVTPTLSDVTGQCTATATAPTTTDTCSGTITGTTSDALTYSTQGTHVITWNFDDGNGNSINVNQNVVIDDTTDPVIPTLSDVTGQCTATATAPTTTDACSGTITGTTSNALTYSTQGTHTITWTFADGNGNSINVNQDVVIEDTVDPVTPTLSDVTGQCTATATAPTTTDACSGTITGTTSDALTYSTQGTHTITWTFDDGNGNTINVNQDVVIDDTVDPVTPTLSDVTGQCTATAMVPTTTDACSGTITGTTSDALTYSTQDTHVITWTFDDGNGNTINVNQNVVIDDVTNPVTPTLADITGQCTATATAPTTTDACSGTITGTTSNALTYSTQGTHTITWTFDDGNGNSINVNQNVVIDDTVDPVTPTLSDVTGQCTATATAPTTTDNCSGTITGTTSDALTYNTQGTHVITWTFDDGNGNSINVDQDVVIDDTTDPVTPTLSDVTGQCTATATALTTTDACSGTITGTTSDALTYSTQGTHTITWTFDDGNGNSINVNQNVVIDDTTDPVTPTLSDVTGQCTATATAPTTTDACSGTITGTTSDALTYSTQGTHVITWNFDDGNGNSINVNQNVVIDDTTDPVTPTLSDVTGQCTATATAPTTTDACSGTITGTTNDALTYSTQGTHTITWTFADGNGNSINVNQDVVIDDTTDPVTPTLSDVTGQCTATATAPTTTDACSGTITGTTSDALTYSTQGTHTITWTFDDGNGNSINVNQNVVIDDTVDPVTPTLSDVTGQCTATATAPTTTDACSGTITGTTSDALTYSTQGTHTITWTFDDGNGNSINVGQDVVIDDTTDPVTPTLSDVTGQCTATATAPTTTDACSGTITGTTSDALTYSTQGTHTITWTFADGNGNSINVNQDVVIDDTTDPVTPTLSDVTGQCTATATAPTTTDACSGTITGTTSDALTYSTQGTHTITWTFDDGNGNSINVNQDVVIDDTTDPVTPILSDVTGQCITTATAPTTTDACSGTITGTTSDALTYSTQGTHTITWTFADGNGNSINVNQNVVIDDTVDPVAVCQPVTISLDGTGNANLTAGLVDGGSADNCGIASISVLPNSFSAIGTYTVTLTVTDIAGNTDDCTVDIDVVDNNAPTPVCQDITIQLDATGNVTILDTDIDGGSTDNGTIVSYSASQTLFDCTDLGANTVTLTVTDDGGNISTCDATVTVEDNIAPAATCQNITLQLDGTGNVSITAGDIDNGSTDNCTIASLSLDQTAFDCSHLGANTVTLTVEDQSGNTTTCTGTVTVEDNELPQITCPSDITVSNDGGVCDAVVTYTTPVGTDNCSGVSTAMTAGLASGSTFPLGMTLVTYEVTDSSGSSASCSFNVIVNDTEQPTVSCPSDITVNNDAGVCGATVIYTTPVGTDNCSGSVTTMTAGQASGTVFPVGTTIVTYQVADASGNTVSCSFNVTVNDTEDPVATCQDITVNLGGGGSVTIVPTDVDNGSADNCAITTSSIDVSIFTAVGTYTVILTVGDAAGNTDNCTSTVTVIVTDTNAPVAICQDITIQLDGTGNVTIVGTDIDNGSTDNGTIVSYVASQTAFDCTHIGANTVTLTVTDDGGNSTDCTSTVTVEDNIAPTAFCQSITVMLDITGNVSITPLDIDDGSTDNCTIANLNLDQTTFDCTHIGANTVTLTVEDLSGNTTTCIATVTVEDDSNPIITECIPNKFEALGNDCSFIMPDYISEIEYFDNCEAATFASIVQNPTPGDIFIGEQVISVDISIIDSSGNTAVCTFTVTVVDIDEPNVLCQDITINIDNSGIAIITPTDIYVGATDNCSIQSLTLSQNTFTNTDIGANTVTLTVTDQAGNVSSCNAVVTVEDTSPPDAICEDLILQLNISGNAFITVSDIDGGSTDNIGIANTNITQTVFECSDIGMNTVTLTVEDFAGNVSTCDAFVEIVDITPPLVICPSNVILDNELGQCGAVFEYGMPETEDNCGVQNIELTEGLASGELFPLGETIMEITATDTSGNTTVCSYSVTVIDSEMLVVECPENQILEASNNCTAILSDYSNLVQIVDNCTSDFSISQFPEEGTVVSGEQLVSFTISDEAGNSVICALMVEVVDTQAPEIQCPEDIVQVSPIVLYDLPLVSDNCHAELNLLEGFSSGETFPHGYTEIEYEAIDTYGNSSTCSFTILVNSNPIGGLDSITVESHMDEIDITVLANDDDPDDDEITIIEVYSDSEFSDVWINSDGTIEYQVEEDWCGFDTLTYTICDEFGACDEVSVIVDVECFNGVNMPQGFSPNDDGVNDFLYIEGIYHFPKNQLEIFNRWGRAVYSAKGYLNTWNGKSNNKYNLGNGRLPEGTYFIFLNLGDGSEPKKSYIYLRY